MVAIIAVILDLRVTIIVAGAPTLVIQSSTLHVCGRSVAEAFGSLPPIAAPVTTIQQHLHLPWH